MRNLSAIFVKMLDICKQFSKDLVNNYGNVPRRGVVPRFSDLEVIALELSAETLGIDSENELFHRLNKHDAEFKNLISRRQFNDRRKNVSDLCERIRKRLVDVLDGKETFFCLDSKPLPVCRLARGSRCRIGKDFETAPNFGYCASQRMYYYGYKLHVVCGLNGVIHSYDLTKASVCDLRYAQDVKQKYSNCTIIADKGYISKEIHEDLFETAHIRLEVPYRKNQKDRKPRFRLFAKARKRIETVFSQLSDQFMMIRNRALSVRGVFTRTIAKVTAFTYLQFANLRNHQEIGKVKYAVFD